MNKYSKLLAIFAGLFLLPEHFIVAQEYPFEEFSEGDSVRVVAGEGTTLRPGKVLEGTVSRSNRRGLGFANKYGTRYFILWSHLYRVNEYPITEPEEDEEEPEIEPEYRRRTPPPPPPQTKREPSYSRMSYNGNKTEIIFGGLATIPTTAHRFNQIAKLGYGGDFTILHEFSDRVAVGLQAAYVDFGQKKRATTQSGSEGTLRYRHFAGSLAGVMRIYLHTGSLRPYLTGAIGANRFRQVTYFNPNSGDETRLTNIYSTDTYFNGGLGLQILLSEYFSTGIEARWNHYTLDKNKFGEEGLSAYTFSTQFGFRF